MLEATSPDGTCVRCEVSGTGPPLLVVHGATADRTRWGAVRDPLADHFRLFLMDRRGRGLSSDEAPGEYALEREAEDIRAVIGAIGEPVRVLGHSYGGTCALEAARSCHGIERMLVYEPAFATDAAGLSAPDALDDVDEALARGDREAALTIFLTRVVEYDDATLAALRSTPVWDARLAAVHTLSRETRAADAYRVDRERMAAIGAPVRFLLGTDTTEGLKRSTLAAHAAIPGSDLRELPGQAHIAMDTDPPLFVREVLDWLGG